MERHDVRRFAGTVQGVFYLSGRRRIRQAEDPGHLPGIIMFSPDPSHRMAGSAHTVQMIPQDRAGEILVKTEELSLIEDKITAELKAGAPIGETFAKYRG